VWISRWTPIWFKRIRPNEGQNQVINLAYIMRGLHIRWYRCYSLNELLMNWKVRGPP
jgi:hypothetical protein